MNRAYRLVWSRLFNSWIVAAESARGRGKGTGRQLAAAALSLSASIAHAAPVAGQVVAGTGSISSSGTITTIQQSSRNLSLNWQSFNIAANQTVQFVQPSASAIAVNRILGNSGTQIFGQLIANGQVYLINPNGILFAPGSQVNVGGLVASTLDLSDASLTENARTFSGNGTGSVINQGTITAAPGGYVALLGNHVSNQGTIVAQQGTVVLGAGSAATLTFAGESLVQMQVDASTLDNLAENGGLIQANGGMVIMTAGTRDALLASVVNNTGVIEARTLANHNGTIELLGGMQAGTVKVGGTLDASAPQGGNGGFIETSAAQVNVANGTQITTAALMGLTGTWLVDPQDFTVAASGGDISGSTLSNALESTNVTLQSSQGGTAGSGNVNVNDAITWDSNWTLTLTASNNVNVNANIAATGNSAGLVINPNTANGSEAPSGIGTLNLNDGASITLSGSSPSLSIASTYNLNDGASITLPGSSPNLSIAGQSYILINSLEALQDMFLGGGEYYALGSTIDASTAPSYTPIGGAGTAFSGTFDGLGHTITDLTINVASSSNGVGLFGELGSGGVIRNLGLLGGSVYGGSGSSIGALVGINYGTVSNSYATSNVSGTSLSRIGGLVGNNYGTIGNSYATGAVSGTSSSSIGGLLGYDYGGAVRNSYATGNVSGTSSGYIGGLLGSDYGTAATISNSHATGSVTGGVQSYVGGLAGMNNSSISNSYATGNVINNNTSLPMGYGSNSQNGGLVGANNGAISASYATGSVTSFGETVAGGLAGSNNINGTISDSYATGDVVISNASYAQVGGLVGYNEGTINDSYAAGSVGTIGASASYAEVGGLVGLSEGGAINGSFWDTTTSGQSTSSGGVGLTTAQMQTQSNFTSATAANGATNPGWDFASTWAMYEGYTYPLLRAFMTPLTVTAVNATQTYNGQTYSNPDDLVFSVSPNGNLFGTVSYSGASPNVGTYAITPQGLYSDQQGYIISYASGMLTVTPAAPPISPTPSPDSPRTDTVTASNVITSIDANVIPQTGGALQSIMPSPTILTTPILPGITPPSNTSANGVGNLMINSTMSIGNTGTLEVVNGGVSVADAPHARLIRTSSTGMTCRAE